MKSFLFLLAPFLSTGAFAVETGSLELVARSANSQNLSSRVFSKGPDSIGSTVIYPASSEVFDRWTYFLAKNEQGIFTLPVWDYDISGELKLMGYAAHAFSMGLGQESCPIRTVVPKGYHWVKVWLFRATLASSSEKQKYDFVQVVSPTWINTSFMMVSSFGSSYIPYRFYRDQDCYAENPDLAESGDCLSSNRVTYFLKLHSIAGNGDPIGNELGMYPFCALQPN